MLTLYLSGMRAISEKPALVSKIRNAERSVGFPALQAKSSAVLSLVAKIANVLLRSLHGGNISMQTAELGTVRLFAWLSPLIISETDSNNR